MKPGLLPGRASALLLALSLPLAAVPAQAAPSRGLGRTAVLDAARGAVSADVAARMQTWRASRWSLGAMPAAYESADDGIQVRWRLNKIKIKAPIDFTLN